AALELFGELAGLRHLWDRRHSAWKRRAILMTQGLQSVTIVRFVCGGLGGVLLPLAGIAAGGAGAGGAVPRGLALASALLCLVGELAERHLFFAAAASRRMPGALA